MVTPHFKFAFPVSEQACNVSSSFYRDGDYIMVTPYLKKLEAIAKVQDSIAVHLLKNGLSKTEIEKITATTNILLHPDVYELFEWKGGFTVPKDMCLCVSSSN